MFIIIVFVLLYFRFLNRIKNIVEMNREHSQATQNIYNQKNYIQNDTDIIDEFEPTYKSDYIHLFEQVQ